VKLLPDVPDVPAATSNPCLASSSVKNSALSSLLLAEFRYSERALFRRDDARTRPGDTVCVEVLSAELGTLPSASNASTTRGTVLTLEVRRP
jgi:hypothetical protein